MMDNHLSSSTMTMSNDVAEDDLGNREDHDVENLILMNSMLKRTHAMMSDVMGSCGGVLSSSMMLMPRVLGLLTCEIEGGVFRYFFR